MSLRGHVSTEIDGSWHLPSSHSSEGCHQNLHSRGPGDCPGAAVQLTTGLEPAVPGEPGVPHTPLALGPVLQGAGRVQGSRSLTHVCAQEVLPLHRGEGPSCPPRTRVPRGVGHVRRSPESQKQLACAVSDGHQLLRV